MMRAITRWEDAEILLHHPISLALYHLINYL